MVVKLSTKNKKKHAENPKLILKENRFNFRIEIQGVFLKTNCFIFDILFQFETKLVIKTTN